MVKNPPATARDTGDSLGQEDPLEEEMATYSSILAGNFHGQRSLAGCCHKESNMTEHEFKQNSTQKQPLYIPVHC